MFLAIFDFFKAFLGFFVASMRFAVQNYVGWRWREVGGTVLEPFQADFDFSETLEMSTTMNECWVFSCIVLRIPGMRSQPPGRGMKLWSDPFLRAG